MVTAARNVRSRRQHRMRPAGRHLLLIFAALVVLGVLVQAALAGRHIGVAASISLHGVLGNVVFSLQLAVVALAVRHRSTPPLLLIAVPLLLMLAAQIGLGYAGRDAAGPVTWHVLNGVALFGLAAVQFARLWSGSREWR